MNASLDELAEQCPELGIPTELEGLAWAVRAGDGAAGRMADELARRGEWEATS